MIEFKNLNNTGEKRKCNDFDRCDQKRKKVVSYAVDFLKSEKHLCCLETLRNGSYGDVLLMHDTKLEAQKVAKVIVATRTLQMEQEIWPELSHENILPAEELLRTRNGTIIFLMPVKFKSLDCIVFDSRFQDEYHQNFKALISWFKDVLMGLEYMHGQHFCHLNLKLSNVLVGYDGRACISDFSFVNFNTNHFTTEDIGLPKAYRPPEAFRELEMDNINGFSVDMWAYGIMVVEAFTNGHLSKSMNGCKSWTKGIWPVLKSICQHETFTSLVQQTFPVYTFQAMELAHLYKFLSNFLQIWPRNRTTVKGVLEHSLFQYTKHFVVVIDDIYPKLGYGAVNNGEEPLQFIEPMEHGAQWKCFPLPDTEDKNGKSSDPDTPMEVDCHQRIGDFRPADFPIHETENNNENRSETMVSMQIDSHRHNSKNERKAKRKFLKKSRDAAVVLKKSVLTSKTRTPMKAKDKFNVSMKKKSKKSLRNLVIKHILLKKTTFRRTEIPTTNIDAKQNEVVEDMEVDDLQLKEKRVLENRLPAVDNPQPFGEKGSKAENELPVIDNPQTNVETGTKVDKKFIARKTVANIKNLVKKLLKPKLRNAN